MQKTHGFLTSLRYRLSRGRSRERLNRKSPTDFPGNESTDYAADYSSENSSSVTPGQTPKHRSSTMSSSDTTKKEALTPSTDTYGNEFDSGNMNIPQGAIDLLHVNILCNEISLEESFNRVLLYLQAEELQRKREASLRQHVFFQLRIHLRKGVNLIAMDKNGKHII